MCAFCQRPASFGHLVGGRSPRGRGSPSVYFKSLLLNSEAALKTAKVFKHGNSQAVRLPKEFRFQTEEVLVKRAAGGVLLLPKRITMQQLDSILGAFRGRFVRRQPRMQRRRRWR